MTMVDRILKLAEWNVIESVIRPGNRFLHDDILDNEALPEIAAQACAAVISFERGTNEMKGVLTALRAVQFLAPVRVNDILHVETHQSAHIDNFYTIEFRIRRSADGVLCAKGEFSSCELA